jgi:hypothetical protein
MHVSDQLYTSAALNHMGVYQRRSGFLEENQSLASIGNPNLITIPTELPSLPEE